MKSALFPERRTDRGGLGQRRYTAAGRVVLRGTRGKDGCGMKKCGRLTALLLAGLLTLSGALAGCSEKAAEEAETGGADQETTAPVQAAEENTSGGEASDALIAVEADYDWTAGVAKNDYGGYEFMILNGCTASWYSYTLVTTEETTGEPVNDAVYERTQRTNEFLNVDVKENNVSDSTAELKRSVKAGGGDFDVALCTLMNSFGIAMEGNILDLNTLGGQLDLSTSWWDQNAVHDLDINGKLYFTTSDFDTTRFDSIRSLYFNKQLVTDLSLENPYDLVDDNRWTLDKFVEICALGESDLDGDGVMTDTDRYGYVTYGELAVDMLTAGAGIRYIDKDPDTGRLMDGTQGEKLVDVYAKIYDLLWTDNRIFDCRQSRYSKYDRGLGDRIQEPVFTENHAIFYSECMAWTRVLREMEADFGVVPPPKFNEDQDRYYSIILNPFMQMIPITEKETERTCNILDVLAAASHDTVVDAYVNVTLTGKVARDPDTVRMLHLVFAELYYNLHFSNIGIRSTIQNGLTGGQENISSMIQKTAKSVNKGLEKVNAQFFG